MYFVKKKKNQVAIIIMEFENPEEPVVHVLYPSYLATVFLSKMARQCVCSAVRQKGG